jgi:hypothetical protein
MRREITSTNESDDFPCYSWDPCRWLYFNQPMRREITLTNESDDFLATVGIHVDGPLALLQPTNEERDYINQ